MLTLTTIDSLAAAPIGSVWQTETGAKWRVVGHAGDYVKLSRVDRPADVYTWFVSTLTQTPAKRIA